MEKSFTTFSQITQNGIEFTECNPTFDKEYDVVLVGAGTAGSIFASKCAALGISLCVIEKRNFMGGIYSSTMFHYYRGSTGGWYESVDRLVEVTQNNKNITDAFGSQPLIRRTIYDRLTKSEKVSVLYNTVLTGVYTQQNQVIGVQVYGENKSQSIKAKIFVDASSEASLCRMAGLNVFKGRDFDGLCQPFSNVRIYYDFKNERVEFNNIDAGTMHQNDPLDYAKSVVKSLNNAVYSNSQVNQFTLGMSPMIGLREGYVIDGLKHLSMKVIVDSYTCNEPLYYSSANFDNHTKEMAFESDQLCDWVVGMSLWSSLVSVPIQKEVMRPKNAMNVLAIGRIMSLDHDVASHTRMMRDCQKAGEAAAILVNQSLNEKVTLDEVTYSSIKEQLKENHCLDESNNYGLKDNPPLDCTEEMSVPKTIEEIVLGLKSDRPGFAMLKAYRDNEIDCLISGLTSNNRNYQVNSALVLALLGNDSGYEILCETAFNRDTYVPKTSKSYNMFRGLSALYCLGRLHRKESYPLIYQMLVSNKDFINDSIHFDKFIGSKEDYRFQYVAHCVRALMTIALENPDVKEEITTKLINIIYHKDFKVCTSLKSNNEDLFDMTPKLKEYIQWRMK